MAETRAHGVADDVLLPEGLAILLTSAGFDVFGRADEPDELLAVVRKHRPDLAIVHIRMPPTRTVERLEATDVSTSPGRPGRRPSQPDQLPT